jgi:hypothetical protein
MPSDAVFFLIRHSGYFESTSFINDARKTAGISGAGIQFYDSNTGKLLFVAPQNRTLEEFLVESRAHGWPSFRGKFVTLVRADGSDFLRGILIRSSCTSPLVVEC